jgi:tripartite-type tricarboxylate transporter receptor subunit TctC
MPKRLFSSSLGAALFALVAPLLPLLPQVAAAQAWPTQPVKIVVSQSAGGSIDIAARLIGQKLGDALGKTFVVDNRQGANGMIAGDAVARAPADGYTLLMTSPSTLTINQFVYRKVPYDALKDFTPVVQTTSISFLLAVNAGSPYRTLAELVAAARADPGGIRYASAGTGNQSHLAAELLAAAAGVKMLHVPYKGEAQAITDLLGNQVDLIFGTMPALLPQVRNGKLRALAVGQTERSAAVPDVPTVVEAGYPTVLVSGWTGILAPAGTPAPIVQRLHDEVVKTLALPEVRETLSKAGAEPVGGTPEQFAAYIRTETVKWGGAVRQAGITPE